MNEVQPLNPKTLEQKTTIIPLKSLWEVTG